MRKIPALFIALFLLSNTSCNQEDGVGESQIDTSTPQLTALDTYIRDTFTLPYNIAIDYRFDPIFLNADRILFPPSLESVRPVLDIIQKSWMEPYNEIGGENFVAQIAPRQLVLVGSFNFNPSGTITLGLAEQGARITLFNIDFLDFSDINSLRQPLRTVQHEYVHILNQNVPIPGTYGEVNPSGYTSTWFNFTNEEARSLGYITAYARSDSTEDFAEMVAEMLTNSREDWDNIVNGIVPEEIVIDFESIENEADLAAAIEAVAEREAERAIAQQSRDFIREKEEIIVTYYLENFDIDIYELQALAFQNSVELVEPENQ